jgi:hypothetical protein
MRGALVESELVSSVVLRAEHRRIGDLQERFELKRVGWKKGDSNAGCDGDGAPGERRLEGGDYSPRHGAGVAGAFDRLTAKVHDRMPVMPHAGDVPRWLDPRVTDADSVTGPLGPYPAEEMEARQVSKRVSDTNNEGPELIAADNSIRELWE